MGKNSKKLFLPYQSVWHKKHFVLYSEKQQKDVFHLSRHVRRMTEGAFYVSARD
jgi:hypothetical protein